LWRFERLLLGAPFQGNGEFRMTVGGEGYEGYDGPQMTGGEEGYEGGPI
jgi:hypothetical protein